MKPITHEDVAEAAELIADALDNPDTWCKDMPAQDAYGNRVCPTDPRAERWCAIGHMRRLLNYNLFERLTYEYESRFGEIAEANDNKGREFVQSALKQIAVFYRNLIKYSKDCLSKPVT